MDTPHTAGVWLTVSGAGVITHALRAPCGEDPALTGEALDALIAEEARAAWRAARAAAARDTPVDLPLSPRGARLLHLAEGVRLWGTWRPAEEGGRLWAHPDAEGRWRRRLLSQRGGLRDLRHDLRGRLFLLSALPDLATHAPPAELLDDLLSDLPALTAFVEERAAPEWVCSPPLPPPPAAEEEAHAALRALTARLSARAPALRASLEEGGAQGAQGALGAAQGAQGALGAAQGAQGAQGALIGALWALTRLEAALKAARRAPSAHPLAPRPAAAPLALRLDALDDPGWALDLCGRPRPEGRLWRLTVTGAGVPWAAWAAWAPAPGAAPRFSPAHAAGVAPPHAALGEEGWAREAEGWMEAWWAAADLLGGGLCAPPEGVEGAALYWPTPRSAPR